MKRFLLQNADNKKWFESQEKKDSKRLKSESLAKLVDVKCTLSYFLQNEGTLYYDTSTMSFSSRRGSELYTDGS